METFANGPLPQFYADRFGWDQDVYIVVRAFNSLSPPYPQLVCIFSSNYGYTLAIYLLRPRLDLHLPPAMSGQNYYSLC